MLSSSTSSNSSDGSLPLYNEYEKPYSPPSRFSALRSLLARRRRVLLYIFITLLTTIILFHDRLKVGWRDFGYIIRPLWDTPREGTTPWQVIPHFSNPHHGSRNNESWCALHGWEARASPAVIVDALPISSEVDLLEVRMREYAGLVSTMIVVESTMTFAGTPHESKVKPKLDELMDIATESGIRLVYKQVGQDFTPNIPKGSFHNEGKQRRDIGIAINDERDAGRIPEGALVLIADADEIISRETLELISTCKVPESMHLNLKNYRFSFDLALPDDGNWVPKTMTVKPGEPFWYTRSRIPDAPLLENAGWHCTFCFPTLQDMRKKMAGYSHNDRLTHPSLLEEKVLRRKVCTGQDPFGMWPVSTFPKTQEKRKGRTRGPCQAKRGLWRTSHIDKLWPDIMLLFSAGFHLASRVQGKAPLGVEARLGRLLANGRFVVIAVIGNSHRVRSFNPQQPPLPSSHSFPTSSPAQEVFTFRDLVIQSSDIKPARSYQHLPLALKQDPKRFPYLVDKGCERPNK